MYSGLAACVLVAVLFSGVAQAVTLGTTDRGEYRSDGFHDPVSLNYEIGDDSARGGRYRAFFIVDRTGVDSISSAKLRLFNPIGGFESADATETLEIFDVSTDLGVLAAGAGGVGAFADLGTGVSFGIATLSAASGGTFVEIDLNDDAITAWNDSIEQFFVVGGVIVTLDGIPNDEHVFAFSETAGAAEFVVTPVPEPDSALLVGLGCLAGLSAVRRKTAGRRLRGQIVDAASMRSQSCRWSRSPA